MKILTTIMFFLVLSGCAVSKPTVKSTEAQIIKTLTIHGCDISQYSHQVAVGKMNVECK